MDRGALDAALELGIDCGGWCPAGRLAEDGRIPARYPVIEMPTSDYSARTQRNVIESDGTLIIANGELNGGTRETLEFCLTKSKPHLVIDTKKAGADELARLIQQFVADNRIAILNVAGPRASQSPEGQRVAYQMLSTVLCRLSGHEDASEYSSD